MLSFNKSLNLALKSTQIRKGCLSIINNNYCAQIDKSDEVRLSYLTDERQGIAVIELNRQKEKNSFSRHMAAKLHEFTDILSTDKNVRAVIIRSLVKGVFCAGADLKERKTMTPVDVHRFVNSLRSMASKFENLPMPTIAAVDGAALGGGLELALSCDLRVASSSAKMGLVETRLAIIPGAGGTQRLPRLINVSLAKELIYTARVFNGDDALKMGIVNHSVPQNDDGDAAFIRAMKLAEEILPNGPVGVRMAKRAISKGIQVDLNSGCCIEEDCYSQIINTKDRLEGLSAFAEKRKPNYTGE